MAADSVVALSDVPLQWLEPEREEESQLDLIEEAEEAPRAIDWRERFRSLGCLFELYVCVPISVLCVRTFGGGRLSVGAPMPFGGYNITVTVTVGGQPG